MIANSSCASIRKAYCYEVFDRGSISCKRVDPIRFYSSIRAKGSYPCFKDNILLYVDKTNDRSIMLIGLFINLMINQYLYTQFISALGGNLPEIFTDI